MGRLNDFSLLDSATDKMNQNVISRYQSMIINEEQNLITNDQGREMCSVPDESTCSKWIEQSRKKQEFQIIVKKDLQDPER